MARRGSGHLMMCDAQPWTQRAHPLAADAQRNQMPSASAALTRSAAWMPIASGTTEKKTRLVGQATQRRMRGREGGTGDVRRDTALSSTSQMVGWCDVIKIPMK